ncbi:MAG TPA: inner-membrane translocator [Bacillus sp. (in: firmicutes)]|nr:inner-membrane translocator [Bacillus sp. (in: firmicutes)]
MEAIILCLSILIVIVLNIVFVALYKKKRFSLVFSGIIMSVFAPVLGFSSGALLHRFYDWSSGGSGEGAAYGGAVIGLGVLLNGCLLVVIGFVLWALRVFSSKNNRT